MSLSIENLDRDNIEEIIYIPKDYISLSFSDTTGLLTIDMTKQNSELSNNTYSNVHIIKFKNNRNLITATINKIYSAAQLNYFIKKNEKTSTPSKTLKLFGIDKEDYFITYYWNSLLYKEDYLIKYKKQKLVSKFQKEVKIDCIDYVIISES